MDKRLIDADKLLEWLENSEEADKFWTTTVPPIEKHDLIKDAINEGKFDPDPIPLPTIKPGDKVNHKKHKDFKNGLVVSISKSGKRAYVSWTGYGSVTYPLTSLEVISHD